MDESYDARGNNDYQSKKNLISTKSYYAVGMAVMNVLFMASAISGITFLEKKSHVFDRVILANVSRWVYLLVSLFQVRFLLYYNY